MKKFFKIFIAAAGLVLYFNANSFAKTDLAAWGGYIFAGNVKYSDVNEDVTGTQCGFKAHYYIELSPSVGLGLGPFAQNAIIRPEEINGLNLVRNSIGLDFNFLFSIPETPGFSPYVRAAYFFYDKFDFGYISGYGYGIGIGCGAEFAITKTIRLFWEFMHEPPNWKGSGSSSEVINAAFNMGIKFM